MLLFRKAWKKPHEKEKEWETLNNHLFGIFFDVYNYYDTINKVIQTEHDWSKVIFSDHLYIEAVLTMLNEGKTPKRTISKPLL